MKDEVILAIILLAAAVLLLILTVIMLCIVMKIVKTKSSVKKKTSEIPKTVHHYDNSAFQRTGNGNETSNRQVSYYGSDNNDQHKSEWPTSYNMYAVSRSYAFPKAGDQSELGSEVGSRAHPSNPPSTIASRSSTIATREEPHKSFSEEVFEGINQEAISYTVLPRSESSSQQETDTRVWKSRTASESASLHSHETNSVHGSTVSQGRDYRVLTEQRSYYSSFKPRSSETLSQVSDVSKNSGPTRERVVTHSIKTSGTKKVFTFDLK